MIPYKFNFALFFILSFISICGLIIPKQSAASINTSKCSQGISCYSTNKYIEYIKGDSNIIITTTHGGTKKPTSIPDRNSYSSSHPLCPPNLVAVGPDANSKIAAIELRDKIFSLTGKRPHLINTLLSRDKLDTNREIGLGACGNTEAIMAWNDFNSYINYAKSIATASYGKGHLFDMHTHVWTTKRAELGYLIEDELVETDAELNSHTEYLDRTSIKSLVNNNPLNLGLAELLRGPYSLGSTLQTNLNNSSLKSKKYTVLPSTTVPRPTASDDYKSGQYTIATHGSKNGGQINATQIENHSSMLNATYRPAYIDVLSRSIVSFMQMYYP